MKHKKLTSILLISVLAVVGCASVIQVLNAWIPVALQSFDSFAAIAAPGNATITNDAAKVVKDFGDVTAAIGAVESSTGIAAKLDVLVNAFPHSK